MSYACLVLGESGTGKTCSLRNLDPKKTLLIQPVRKPLPFPSKGWKEIKEKGDGGNIFVNSDPTKIVKCMYASPFDIIVVDDWQYILALMFMSARNVKGFDKFTDIGGAGFDIAKAAPNSTKTNAFTSWRIQRPTISETRASKHSGSS